MEVFGSFGGVFQGVYELKDGIFRARVRDATYLVGTDKFVLEEVGC